MSVRSVTNSERFVPCTRLRVGERVFSSAASHQRNALPLTSVSLSVSPSPMNCCFTYRHQASRQSTNIQKETQDLSFLKTSMLVLLYFIIPFLVHIAYICVNSWSSSHVSCMFRFDSIRLY